MSNKSVAPVRSPVFINRLYWCTVAHYLTLVYPFSRTTVADLSHQYIPRSSQNLKYLLSFYRKTLLTLLTEEYFHDPGVEKYFLSKAQIAVMIKRNIVKLGYIKIA